MASNNSTVNGLKLVSFDSFPLITASSLKSTAVVPLAQGGVPYDVTLANLTNYIAGNIPGNTIPNATLLGGNLNTFVSLSLNNNQFQISANTLSAKTNAANALLALDSGGLVPIANLPIATTGTKGIVEPDGSTITITAGVITATTGGAPPNATLLGGTGSTFTQVGVDNTTLHVSGGTLSAITNAANGLAGFDGNRNLPIPGLLFETINQTVIASGSSRITATPLTSRHNFITAVISGTGVSLVTGVSAGATIGVYNTTTTNVLVYPATASGKINGGVSGSAVQVITNANFLSLGSDNWTVIP